MTKSRVWAGLERVEDTRDMRDCDWGRSLVDATRESNTRALVLECHPCALRMWKH